MARLGTFFSVTPISLLHVDHLEAPESISYRWQFAITCKKKGLCERVQVLRGDRRQ